MERRKLNMRVNTYVPCTRFITFAAMRGSISIAVACFACSRIFTVRFPVSGPTSSTLSVSFRLPKQSEYHEEQSGHSFKRITSTILPYMSNTPRSRNRCIPLACLGIWGDYENVLDKTSSVADWIGHLCIVRCRLGSWLMYTRKFIPGTNYYK